MEILYKHETLSQIYWERVFLLSVRIHHPIHKKASLFLYHPRIERPAYLILTFFYAILLFYEIEK